MIQLRKDGSASYLLDDKAEVSRSVHLSADGLLYVGHSDNSGFTGMGVLFAGDSFLISNFQKSCPTGKSIRFANSALLDEEYHDNSRTRSVCVESASAAEYFRDYCENFKFDHVGIFPSLEPEDQWETLIPAEYWISSISVTSESSGYLGSQPVVLTTLSSHPPRGVTEIIKGISTKNKDIWFRRFERLMNHSEYPHNILRPLGLFKRESGEYFVVSSGSNVTEEVISPSYSSVDSQFEMIDAIVASVTYIHSIGVTFTGRIHPKMFIHTECGDVFLNTGYLISQHVDTNMLLGGFEDLRFVSPYRIRNNLSVPMETARNFLGINSSTISAIEDDSISVGLLISAMLNGCPFPGISHSHYILLSLTGDTSGHCSMLYQESNPEVRITVEDLDPAKKIAHKLIEREMTLSQVTEAVNRYKQWRDEIDGTSVETEVKAVFSKVSSIFHSSQERIKQSIGRNDLW